MLGPHAWEFVILGDRIKHLFPNSLSEFQTKIARHLGMSELGMAFHYNVRLGAQLASLCSAM